MRWLARHLRFVAAMAALAGLALQVPYILDSSGWPQRTVQLIGLIFMSFGIGILVRSSRWGQRRRAIYDQTRAHERRLGEEQARRRGQGGDR